MKLNLENPFRPKKSVDLVILLGAHSPDPQVLDNLAQISHLTVREAFSTRGVLQNLSGVQLVILGDLIPASEVPQEVLQSALDHSGIPVATQNQFLSDPGEWLGRARLSGSKQVSYLPARQINLVNWSGGVGKTTLAMAVCNRFVKATGLPAALLELSLGGSALHARISPDLPEFFDIATHKAEPAVWNGISLFPMDGRTIDVLWGEDPEGVKNLLKEIQHRHTLFVVDCFPGHPLFPELTRAKAGRVNLVVTSPRDDAILQARRLMTEMPEPRHLILNMAKSVSDRAEGGVSLVLPYRETWAHSLDFRLADPLLKLVYPGWKG